MEKILYIDPEIVKSTEKSEGVALRARLSVGTVLTTNMKVRLL